MATVVLAKPDLESFCGIPLKELRADSLSQLNLFGKGVGEPGALVVAHFLRVSRSLSSIDISNNKLGDKGKRVIAKAIPSSTLQSLKCDALDLRADATSVDLSRKMLGASGAELLAACMTKFMGSLSKVFPPSF